MEQSDTTVFADATALARAGDSVWRCDVSDRFGGPVPGFAFGGYLAAVMLRAGGEATTHTLPVSFTMHYLRPVPVGATLDVEVRALSNGRRAASLQLVATVDRAAALTGLLWVGERVDGPEHVHARAPVVDGRDRLDRHDELVAAGGRRPPTTMLHWEKRLSESRPSLRDDGEAERVYREWSRLPLPAQRDEFLEAGRYVLPIDSSPWQAVRHAQGQLTSDRVEYLMPTLELTAHFHRFQPQSEWLLHETVAPVAAGGYSSGATRVWSEHGDLLTTGMSAVTFRRI